MSGSIDVAEAGRLRIRSICGSLRKASFNAGLRRALAGLAPAGIGVEPLDGWDEFPFYDGDIQSAGFPAAVERFGAAIRAADGLILCTPEYNHSVPGGLKNAIDWLSRLPDQPFADKPIALLSASTGAYGGVRGQMAIRPILAALDTQMLNRPAVMVTEAKAKFDEGTGDLTDAATQQQIGRQLAAFETFVRRLRA